MLSIFKSEFINWFVDENDINIAVVTLDLDLVKKVCAKNPDLKQKILTMSFSGCQNELTSAQTNKPQATREKWRCALRI